MAYIGNIGNLLNSIYVRDKLPNTKLKNLRKQKQCRKKNIREIFTPILSNEDILYNKLLKIRVIYKEEIRIHGEQTEIKEGFVYVIINKSYPGWVKIGMAFDYEKRLSIYNQYDPEMKFKIEGIRWTPDRRSLEKKILENVSQTASKQRGEWFRIEKDTALDILYAE